MKNESKVRIALNATQSGITLIALIITIILMLILAGTVISLTLGENGLFNTAKYAVKKTQEESAKEKVQLMLADYMKERYINTKTLEEYLNEKKQNGELDEVINNNDGTIKVEVDGYEVTIKEDELSITNTEKAGGVKPEVEIQITELDSEETKKALTINITNISEYGDNYTIEVEDSTGNKIAKEENVIENLTGQASYIITETETYTITVKGTKDGIEKIAQIVELIKVEKLDDWKNLAILAKLNISDYSDLNDMINNEHAMDQILESEEATNYLVNSTETIFPAAIQNRISAEKILNNEVARELLYNNADKIETLLQNSEVAINIMVANSELVYCSGQASSNNTKKTIYSGKAFVISFSCNGYTGSGAGTIYHGNYINGNSFLGVSPANASGTQGEKLTVCKFASSVQAYRTEYTNRTFNYYALIFKI